MQSTQPRPPPARGDEQTGHQLEQHRQPGRLERVAVDGHAARGCADGATRPRRCRRTNPITTPITGTTKKPTLPTTTPANIDTSATPASLNRRPGTRYLMTWLATKNCGRGGENRPAGRSDSKTAHTTTAPHTRSKPGSTGMTMPTSPTTIASPTTTSPAAGTPSDRCAAARRSSKRWPKRRRGPAPARPASRPGAAGELRRAERAQQTTRPKAEWRRLVSTSPTRG